MAPPPGRRLLRPALQEGEVLAGRYRLTRRVTRGSDPDVPGAVLWQAEDEVLARRVAVKVLTSGGRREAGANRFLDAGAAAGAVDLPVFARVYDAAVEERAAERLGEPAGTIDIAYVISEWVEGRTVNQVLRTDGPLEPAVALELTLAAADALEAAAARGLSHGRLHPGNVALTSDGRIKLLDLGVAAALAGAAQAEPDRPGPSPVERDTRDLAAVLYAMLTGRWPAGVTDQPSAGVRTVTGKDGYLRPRQLSAAVPRALDEVVTRALAPERVPDRPALRRPGQLAAALAEAAQADAVRPGPRAPRLPPTLRKRLPLLLVGAFLLAVGGTSYLLGLAIGEVRTRGGELEALAEPATGPAAPGGGGPVDLRASAQIRDFDPSPPGDGREAPGAVGNAFDGDPTTAWETERYDTPELGGLKPGVGLLVDLGVPTPVAAVQLGLRPGTTVELRAADEVGPAVADFPVVTTAGESGEVVRLDAGGRTARYWLVVLTRLPAERGGFRGAVSELLFLRG